MARCLRIVRAGAWYHVTARGNERRAIFRDERDRRHFLELMGRWAERFREHGSELLQFAWVEMLQVHFSSTGLSA